MHLTLLHDPAGITGRHLKELDAAATLQANIERILPGGGGDVELRINGQRVDPLTDTRLDEPPREGDAIMLVRRPAGLDPITWAVIGIAALAVYTYTQLPKIPGLPTANDSPNNKLTGQTNIARAYQAIPDVYGYRRVWPDLIQPSLVEYIDDRKHVTEWMCISRGKGTVTAVQYADTDLLSFDGASFDTFEPASGPSDYPELNDTTLTDVLEGFESPEVNNIELNYSTGVSDEIARTGTIVYDDANSYFEITFVDGSVWDYTKSIAGTGTVLITMMPPGGDPWFPETCDLLSYVSSGGYVTFRFDNTALIYGTEGTFSKSFKLKPTGGPSSKVKGPYILPVECERLRWNLVFARGLQGTAEIEVNWWQVDGSGDMIIGTDEVHTYEYTAASPSEKAYTEEVTPAAGTGRYAISFERMNVDTDYASTATLESVYGIRYHATKVLPGVTVLKVTQRASAGAAGATERKFNCRWGRHIRTLSSTTLSESRNFARALAHLWCVAGEDLAQLDTTALAAINTALGETSALLRFDGSLDDADASLGERMQRIADTARCVLWRSGTKWTVTRDEARAFPELQLDYRNLAASGDSTISYAAHMPASHDGVEVEYTDEASQSKKAYIRLDISSGAVATGASANPKKFKMPGCATEAQADNRAQLEARRLMYSRTSVQDTALADASQLGVGSLVRWVDPNDFAGDDGLQAGEVLAIDSLTLTTSEPLDWHGEVTGRILVTGVDGLYIGSPVVCTPGATANKVVLASVPAGTFVRSATRQLGSRYAFAVGMTEAEMQAAGLFTVTEVTPAADRTLSVSLASYDARMFEED